MDSMCDYSYLLGVSVFSSFTGCTEVPLPFLPRRLVETDSNTNLTHNTFSVLGCLMTVQNKRELTELRVGKVDGH
jgi:hypothetical protein